MSKHFVLVDDDQDILIVMKMAIELEGHRVTTYTSSVEALDAIRANPPDCVLTDIMMPELDGVELTRKLRSEPATAHLKIVVVSGKIYHTDRQRALDAGADGFIVKSRSNPDETLSKAMAMLEQRVSVKFWGCRGTIPVPGPDTLKYGGNTSCVSMTFPDGHLFVFDAGTGIKPLGNALMKSGQKKTDWNHLHLPPPLGPHQLFSVFCSLVCARQPVPSGGLAGSRDGSRAADPQSDGGRSLPDHAPRIRSPRDL